MQQLVSARLVSPNPGLQGRRCSALSTQKAKLALRCSVCENQELGISFRVDIVDDGEVTISGSANSQGAMPPRQNVLADRCSLPAVESSVSIMIQPVPATTADPPGISRTRTDCGSSLESVQLPESASVGRSMFGSEQFGSTERCCVTSHSRQSGLNGGIR